MGDSLSDFGTLTSPGSLRRLAAADWLADRGREAEERHLRGPGPVAVIGGRAYPLGLDVNLMTDSDGLLACDLAAEADPRGADYTRVEFGQRLDPYSVAVSDGGVLSVGGWVWSVTWGFRGAISGYGTPYVRVEFTADRPVYSPSHPG
jgi:hypothetical protein